MDIKAKLMGAQWRKHLERDIDVDGETVHVIIRRPPPPVLLRVLEEAQGAGEMDAQHQPTSSVNGLRVLARMTALCLFAPDAVRPMFERDEINEMLSYPWLLELQEDVLSAMGMAGKLVEAAKGNSAATPT